MPSTPLVIFHKLLEKEVEHIKYGTVTFTMIVKSGMPVINSINIVRNKRRKYKNGARV